MKSDSKEIMTPNQLTMILTGSMIGIGVLALPNDVIKAARQSGWILCLTGVIYPLYMLFLANVMLKKHPDENILKLSKKCFGKIAGSVLNVIFVSFFLFLATEVSSGISNVLRIFVTPFLSNYKVLLVILLLAAFNAHEGIETVARMNEVIFYLSVAVFFIPFAAIKGGNILNLSPVFDVKLMEIVKGTKDTVLVYSGAETMFLIYPYLNDKNAFMKSGLKGIAITAAIYAWLVFITIYYLGMDISPKFLWPIVTVAESFNIPVISNFRYVFIVLWSMIMFKNISNQYYCMVHGIGTETQKISEKSAAILIYPLVVYLSSKYGAPTFRRSFTSKAVVLYTLFNIAYVSLIALISTIKKGVRYEK